MKLPKLTSINFNWSTIISVFALFISLYSMNASLNSHSDSSSSDMIRQNYDDFLQLHQIRADHPLQSHIFVNLNEYEVVKGMVIQALDSAPKRNRIEYQLTEAALARRIFSMYEASYFQWKNSEYYNEKTRANFLKLVLDYYTKTLLRNPRLLWYWSGKGGNLSSHYEDEVVKYYYSKINNTTFEIDSDGPYKNF